MEQKYYNYETGNDIIQDADYILDIADDEFISHNFEQYLAAMEIHNAKEKRVRKAEIEKRRLNQKHQQKLKRNRLYGFIAGTVLMACVGCVKPSFMGGEELANDVYSIMVDEGYGWNNYENGWVFNHGTQYVDFDDAIEDIRTTCYNAGYNDAQIDVALSKILHLQPEHSTLAERIEAKKDRYYQEKVEEKGVTK